MGVKIFSHKSDPDGIGCVLLSLLCFKNVSYTLCKNNLELDEKISEFLEQEDVTSYEHVYITDLCPSKSLLEKMAFIDAKLFQVYDHHLTSLKEKEKPSFVYIGDDEKDCAMSIFYQELIKDFPALKENKTLEELVYLTRLHDTWAWKKENNQKAFLLETFHHYLGPIGYLYYYKDKCLQNCGLEKTEEENSWLLDITKEETKKVKELLQRVVFEKEENINFASVYGPYSLRNLLADALRKDYPDCDVLALFAPDNGTISFRSLKNIDVLPFAEKYHGGGHPKAAGCSLTKENEIILRKKLMKD